MEFEVGQKVKVTPKDGNPYHAYVRGVHEGGLTVWLDPDAKEDGEIHTLITVGPDANASVE